MIGFKGNCYPLSVIRSAGRKGTAPCMLGYFQEGKVIGHDVGGFIHSLYPIQTKKIDQKSQIIHCYEV